MNTFPKLAWWLGYAGLIPFLLATILIGMQTAPPSAWNLSFAWVQANYAAVILSFLGAISWGVVMAASQTMAPAEITRLLIYSVTPALLAWVALLLPVKSALFVLAGLIVLAYLADSRLLFKRLNAAYATLRLHLTVVAATLLVVSAMLTT